MASTAGSIVLGIFADIAQLKTDLGRANQNIDAFASKATHSLTTLTKMATGFASAFAGIGLGLGAAGFASLIKSTTDAADQIGDLSERLGISTDLLQAYQYAAKDAGSSVETVSTAFAKFNQLLGEANAKEDEAVKLFARLGIATTDAAGNARTTEAAFRELADKIQQAGSVADKTAIAKKFLGKAGAELVPIFAAGAAGADKLVVKLRELGMLAEADMLQQYDALSKEFAKLSTAMSVSMMKAVITLQPQLLALGGAFITAATGAAKLFEWFTPDSIASLDLLARRIKETREAIDKELKIQATPGVTGWVQGLGSTSRLEKLRKTEADQLDRWEKAREAQATATPKLGAGLGADPDSAAAKKAAALAKKAREEKQDADTKAVMDSITLEERMREEGAETLKFLEKLGTDTATTRADAAMEEADRVAHGLAIEAKLREEMAADIKRVDAEAAEIREKDREAYLAGVKQKADAEAELEAIKADYYEKEQARLDADMAKRGAMFDKLFDPFTRAFETSVTGIIQGTTTLEAAFQKMGQSIAISLGETAVKEGVDALKKALKELLQSQMVQQLIKAGLSAAGGLFTSGAGVTVAPVQNIDYNFGGAGMPMAAGGIVQSPTFAVVGEAGPEAVVPLDRWGEMGGGVTVNIIDQRREGNVQTQEKTTASGERQVDVLITDVVRSGIAGGAYDRALGGSFGLSRRGVHR